MKRKEEVREKMHKLAIIESILNFFDCGIVIETFKNSLKTEMEMGLKNFIRHLFFGKGYADLTPPRLSEQMALQQDLLIVDLRDERKYKQNHIKGAISHPFEDFLKSILIDEEYGEFKQKDLVLVCDTGHQSRVAASILAEEGFVHAASLNRGMRRWNKWQELLRIQKRFQHKRSHCCATVIG